MIGIGGYFLWPVAASSEDGEKTKISSQTEIQSARQKIPISTQTQSSQRVRLSAEQLVEKLKYFHQKAPEAQEGIPAEHQILLRSRRIVVKEGERVTSLKENRFTRRGTFPLLVQLRVITDRTAREQIAACGARVVGVIPNRTVLVESSLEACEKISQLKNVRGVVEFAARDKLSPSLAEANRRFEGRVKVRILPLAADDLQPIAEEVVALGGDVHSKGSVVVASVELSSLPKLAGEGAVRWIEQWIQPTISSDRSLGEHYLAARQVWDVGGLDGTGIKIAHSDLGIDTGNLETLHPDLQKRVKKIFPMSRKSNGSDRNGHGTHTAGSIVGDGSACGGKYKGTAPGADLYSYAMAPLDNGYIDGLPEDLRNLFILGYQEGARIHSASWGGANFTGDYTFFDRSADDFAWRHPDFLLVVAAGNSGEDRNNDGVVDLQSIASPALSKNCLSVGAAESGRPPKSGGYTSVKNVHFHFYTEPIKSDYVSSSTNGLQGIACFSSRGPAADGRIKPEVVAPGTDIISTKSSLGQSGWGLVPNMNGRYCYNGGTSMSTPQVSGGAALMRQYAIERAGITNPSAALVKAMLMNGARSLYPGQYDQKHLEIPHTSPNSVEGWGHANFARSLYPQGQNVFLYDHLDIPNATTNRFEITVSEAQQPLCATLVWVDCPAVEGGGKCLVNDYDLEIVSPDGIVSYPNDGTGPDRINNVERILISEAQQGTYEIRVIAQDCSYGADEGGAVALCVSGAIQKQPEIVCIPQDTFNVVKDQPFPIEFTIHTLAPLTNAPDAVLVHYRFGTESTPTGSVNDVSAQWVSNSLYRAEIFSFPFGTYCHYQIDAVGTNETRVVSPMYCTYLNAPVKLSVLGNPKAYGFPEPMYGDNVLTLGDTVSLSAPGFVPISKGVRMRCQGYVGSGDVPFFGTTNQIAAKIEQDSSITWAWFEQYALGHQLKFILINQVLESRDWSTTWYDKGSIAQTLRAPDIQIFQVPSIPAPIDVVGAFSGWIENSSGKRYPSNSLRGITMDQPKQFTAEYREFWTDSDGDGISDWWVLRYFGTIEKISPKDDPDGDGFMNMSEFLDNTDPNDSNSFPTPPEIILYPIDPFQTQYPPWKVNADIFDNLSVEKASLLWREDGEEEWHEVPMQRESTNLFFTAYLDPPSMGGKRVEYCVEAFDLLGIMSQYTFGSISESAFVEEMYDSSAVVVVPDCTLDCQFHRWSVETNFELRVENAAGPETVWTGCLSTTSTVLDPQQWSGEGWSRTRTRTENGSLVWYCGDPKTCEYLPSTFAHLESAPIQVPDQWTVLSVRHWIESEQENAIQVWDGGIVEVSLDQGEHWSALEPCGGYPMRIVDNPDSLLPGETPCFGGEQGSWRNSYFSLNAFVGREIKLRFTFSSDQFTNKEGWYIGELRLHMFEDAFPCWIQYGNALGGVLREQEAATMKIHVTSAGLLPHEPESALLGIFSATVPRFQTVLPFCRRLGNLLTLTAGAHGTISASQTFLCAPDNNPEISVQAKDYCQIATVQGTGGAEFLWTTNVPVMTFSLKDIRADTTVDATFVELLAKHGVPLAWYASFGITNDFDCVGEKDNDGDSLQNWQEYYTDTCPTNPFSSLKILSFSDKELTWQGGKKRAQMIQHTDNLTNAWKTIHTIQPPTPQTNSFSITTNGFYRISVEAPE